LSQFLPHDACGAVPETARRLFRGLFFRDICEKNHSPELGWNEEADAA
jgi:hypothetical protein